MLKRTLLCLAFFTVFCHAASFASHVVGGQLEYKYVGKTASGLNRYIFSIKIYRDATNGTNLPASFGMDVYREAPGSIKPAQSSFMLDAVGPETEVIPPAPPGCSYSGPIEIHYQLYQSDTIDLPVTTTGYHIVQSTCCRNSAIINAASNAGSSFYTFMPPSSIINSSPVFTEHPIPFLCTGVSTTLLNSALDPDGDVLTYRLVTPYDGAMTGGGGLNWPIPDVGYQFGYSLAQPFGAGGSATIDPQTGVSTYQIPIQGSFIIGIEVSEYRNGQLIGITRRDIQILSEPCFGTPVIPDTTVSYGLGDTELEYYIREGESLNFPIYIKYPNSGDSMQVNVVGPMFNTSIINPAATLTGPSAGRGDLTQQFSWNTACGQGSSAPYPFTVSCRRIVCPPDPQPYIIEVKVFVLPTVPTVAGPDSVCPFEKGNVYTTRDTSGSTYKWMVSGGSPGSGTGNNITVDWLNPSQKGVVSIIETSNLGCLSDTITYDVAIRRKIKISAGGPQSFCSGDTIILGPSSNDPSFTYSWLDPTGLSSISVPNPTLTLNNNGSGNTTSQYFLEVTTPTGCFSRDSAIITVRPRPVPDAGPPSVSFCTGDTIIIGSAPQAQHIYNWVPQTGLTTPGSSQTKISLPNTGTTPITAKYLLVDTLNGCPNTDSITVTINPLPTVTTAVLPDNQCPGTAVSVTAAGGIAYNWAEASAPATTISNNNTINIAPSVTTTYLVTVTDNNACKNTASSTVTVLPACVVQIISSPKDSLCFRDSISLTGSSASATSYSWATENLPSDTIEVGSSHIYNTKFPTAFPTLNPWGIILTGRDNNGCLGKDTIKINILPLPAVKTFRNRDSICPGDSVRLVGRGAVTYEWKNILNAGAPLSSDSLVWVTPTVTSTYVITGRDASPLSCESYDTIQVYVRPRPPVTVFTLQDTVCKGSLAVLSGTGAQSYQWSLLNSPSAILSSNKNYLVSPTSTEVYLLTGTDQFGCINKDTAVIATRALPVILTISTPDSICPGSSASLKARGAKDYLWADITDQATYLANDSVLSISPTATSTYVVTATDRFSCVNKDTISVHVKNKPQGRRIVGSPYVCPSLTGVEYKVTDTIPGFPVSSSTFSWTVTRGMPSSGQLTDTDSLSIDFSSSPGVAEISVVELNNEDCYGDTIRFYVDIKSIFTPPAPIGDDSICSRDSAGQVYVTPFNTIGSTYDWFVSGGTIVSGNGTNRVTVDWNTASGGNPRKIWYEERSVTATDNCYGLSDTLFVTIFPSPVTGQLYGRQSVCIGDKGKSYFVRQNNTSVFTWTLQGGGTIRNGNGTNSISIDWDNVGVFQLTVYEKTSASCDADPVTVNVTVNALPVVAGIQGPAVVCPSSTKDLKYYITGSNPTSTYSWSIKNGTIKSGNGTDTVVVDWNADFFNTGSIYDLSVVEWSKDSCASQVKIYTITLDGQFPYIEAVTTLPSNEKEVELTWPLGYVSGQLSKYNVYRRTLPDTTWTLVGNNLLDNRFTDKDVLTQERSYQYRYTVQDACGDSSTARPHNSILLGAVKNADNNNVTLDWSSYRNWRYGLEKYELWRRLDDQQTFSFYQALDTTSSVTFNDSKDGFIHCYRIRAIEKTSGAVSWSNDTCVEFDNLIHIPSAFSPNDDGTNDRWVIRNSEAYKTMTVEIFNRWGEKVYFSSGYRNDWDGTANSKALPDGTYFYVVKLNRVVKDQKESYSGTVTIIR